MAGLSVIFRAVDEISSRFDAMVSAGTRALDSFDRIEAAADSSYDVISEGAAGAADAMERAAAATDYWTDRIGNYDREAMQAIYSIEELVEMGYMSEEALNHLGDALDNAADDLEDFGDEAEDAGDDAEDFGERSQSAVEGLDKLLATVGIVTALTTIGSAFMGCSQAAAEFETNVAMVSTVADTTVLSVGELSAQISDLSMDTARNVNELADASYNATSAGVATEAAVETVGEASKLATAGFTSSSSALSVLTTTLNAYGLEASEVTNISDSLVTSQNLGVLTIDQMASSMGKAISTASAYSVDLYNLESGYISLTKAGISVEESTTYISSMFNELGSVGSNVATIITEETGMSFGQLMNAGYSLADVLDIVYERAGRDGEAMMNLWGSAEAGKAANAIINQGLDTFNSNLEKLANSAGTTQAAYEAMTNTTAFSTERMENSFNNLSIAIGDDLNPVVSQFQNGISDVTDGFTRLINEHPSITAVLTGIVVGVGAVTLAVTAYTAVTEIAAVASAALGATMTAALGPVMLIAAAVGALTAGIIYFANATEDETASMTAATKAQYNELQSLNTEYEIACEKYGETSEEASRLKYKIDDLSESFESDRQTVEEFTAEVDALCSSTAQISDSFNDSLAEISSQEAGALALIQKYEDLTSQMELTKGQEKELEAVTKKLSEHYPDLAEQLDGVAVSAENYAEALRAACEQEAEQRKEDAAMETYTEALKKRAELTEEIAKAEENVRLEQERINNLSVAEKLFVGAVAGSGAIDEDLELYKDALEELNNAQNENEDIISRIEENWEATASAAEEAGEAQMTAGEAATEAISGVSEHLEELCSEYDKAYESALNSIQGQYSLWDSIGEIAAMSSNDITEALQSQIDFWESYSSNLDGLMDKAASIEGLESVLNSVADGSEDSAAMLAGMASMSDEQLSAMVEQYNKLQTSQEETAKSMAELATDFESELDEIQTAMEEAVSNMNMEDEAKKAAIATMDAYISAIKNKTAEVHSAMGALTFANNDLNGYATGTSDAAPGLALVGEEGPELVNFRGGEVVYTASETSNILSQKNEDREFYVPPVEEPENGGDPEDKIITLKIEGSGEMKVGGRGASKEDIIDALVENIRGILMDIIRQEIMEEGDMSYEF